jgi:hypothetical protein
MIFIAKGNVSVVAMQDGGSLLAACLDYQRSHAIVYNQFVDCFLFVDCVVADFTAGAIK